jgi:membrane-associated phospholipid phosphatase
VVPLVRRRFGVHPAVTTAAAAAGPFALAVLRPRTRRRDVALYALQMWAFTVIHELPYDDPERLRRRLRVRYPIKIDRALGGGELPNVRLQRALGRKGEVTLVDRALAVVHWVWFFQPHLTLLYVLARNEERFAASARAMAVTYDIGCALYILVPTAPPWWASENGYMDECAEPADEVEAGAEWAAEGDEAVDRVVAEVAAADAPALRRIMVDVGERTWGRAWPTLYDSLGGNPWAAMPSLHFGSSLMAAMLLSETGPRAGAAGWAYALTLGFALVYLGEHYVTDLLAGAALVLAVRRGEPLGEPVVLRVNAALQRLERIANA